jgi:ferric-dicitrate binding protein FerR (iron transport regulator)
MEEKLKILRRYFSNKYSRNDYFELKRLILTEDSEIELLLQTHWNEFKTEEKGANKDLSEVLANLNKRIDEESGVSFIKKIFIAYSRIAAILVIPLFLALGFLYFQFNQYLFQKDVFVDVASPAGLRTSLNLPDGSMVWLNGDSHISYPVVFGKNREVRIEGEAFFKVKSDKKHPFLVSAKDIVVRATGTQFNVMAYNDIPEVRVILKEGKVAILDDKQTVMKEMGSGFELRYNAQSSSVAYNEINTENYSAWISGRLMFSYATMSEVVERMEKWYGVDIEVVDKELLQLHFKATFDNENIEEALKLLQSTAAFTYKFSKRGALSDGTLEKSKIYITKK